MTCILVFFIISLNLLAFAVFVTRIVKVFE